MPVKTITNPFRAMDWQSAIPLFRYAFGATIILAVAAGADYTLSYITPVLALGFLAPGSALIPFKKGILFVLSLAIACWVGVIFSRLFLNFQWVFLLLIALAILHLFYSDKINPLFKVWLIASLLLVPLLSSFSYKLGAAIAISLVQNAAMAIMLVWVVFFIFPYRESALTKAKQTPAPKSPNERFRRALQILVVIFPILVLFHVFQLAGSILVLIFVAILSLNPVSFSVKSGLMLILANLIGGVAAILAFNLFTIVPSFTYLILISALVGLVFGQRLFSDRPTAALYGTAFSTFLLVLGTVTTSDGEAGEKVWSRIFQIGIAVTYFVIAYRIANHFIPIKEEKTAEHE